MKPEPIHEIVSRINKMPIDDQVDELVGLVAAEKIFSVRRNELESLLRGKRDKQLRKEIGRRPRRHFHGATA